ncbi:tripartite motif containing protein thin isoform X2 [Lycorma delicatula]|uniref:tripartite motif containing protein thin isoform X2 n=1 Tax=Lycorma delicatula TaxID=130591 RepID=UPI003F50E050
MEQFEQLLTCAICLDRYRNPKLLPCQHSFCMEPCMDGLVDYVRRQVKCPECRAEHRIPYQGVQGYPTNVTLQRFLELHIEITGELPDPTSGQIMKRCGVCSEKAYCTHCMHCDKDVCPDCKGAHMDILRREITRINNQIRRALHRLQDMLGTVEKNMLALQTNCSSVSEEVDEIYRRLAKALKDRTEYLRGEMERYLGTEVRNLSTLKQNLEQEISNISSNCDLADKHMQSEAVEWDDCELMDAKEIFLKTVDFIRNFECDTTTDYNRRVRFVMAHDPNQLVLHLAGYGELSINIPHQPFISMSGTTGSSGSLQPPGPGLMRSKSDHRLAQYRQQEERGYEGGDGGTVSPLGGRKFGERYPQRNTGGDRYDSSGGGRYGRGGDRGDYGGDYGESTYGDTEGTRPSTRSRLRSRFGRHAGGDNADSDNDTQTTGRSVRFSEGGQVIKERERVLDTEDVSKGPLSGITRLYDSPRVMKRLQESENKKDKEPVQQQQQQQQTPKFTPQTPKRPQGAVAAQRQVSEEDEITKIKRLNKNAPGEPRDTPATQEVTRPAADRVQMLKRTTVTGSTDQDDREQPASPTSPASSRSTPSSDQSRKSLPEQQVSSEGDSEEDGSSVSSLQPTQRKTPAIVSRTTPAGSTPASRRSSTASDTTTTTSGSAGTVTKKSSRSASSDSNTSSNDTSNIKTGIINNPKRNTGAAYTTEEVKQMMLSRAGVSEAPSAHSVSSNGTTNTSTSTTKKPFQSRFLGTRSTTTAPSVISSVQTVDKTAAKDDDDDDDDEEEETETSSETEETDSDEESGTEDTKPSTTVTKVPMSPMEKTDIGPLLARSAQARDSGSGSAINRRSSRDDGYSSRYGDSGSYRSPYSSKDEPSSATTTGSSYLNRNRNEPEADSSSRYGSSGFTSRFLNKSKSTAAVSPDEEEPARRYANSNDDGRYTSARSRYAALKDRKSRLARSKSTHTFGAEDDDDTEDTTTSPTAYYASKYGGGGGNELSRSRSTHALKSRENSPDRTSNATTTSTTGTGTGEKDGAALSSWARYLKNKYGNRGKDSKESTSGPSASRRLSLGLPLRNNSTVESSDDDQKNLSGSPTSPTQTTAPQAGFVVGTSPRSQYLQKRRQLFKIGSRGSEPGCFTWPRGIAVGPDNSIVVADSSNHRVQVFDSNGIFVKEFGTYGNGEGEFDCLAGVAVNRIGQFIIADRYNHRIQVFDPAGRFLRTFGSQGTADGRFNYPWGITTDALGFIYVCDKENHRVQVFQSDGTFVGKFGTHGNKAGQLEHPHYIAVSNTNRVIVSDSNNHRIQIFDVNGRVLSSFGSEGSENGQFKFPRDNTGSECSETHDDYNNDNTAASSSTGSNSNISHSQISSDSCQLSSNNHHNHHRYNSYNNNINNNNDNSINNHQREPNFNDSDNYNIKTNISRSSSTSSASGSGSGRSGLHICRRFRQQSDTDIPTRRSVPESFRMLGIRGRGIQGTGGSSSYVQREYPSVRPGKSSHPSFLRSVSTEYNSYDSLQMKLMKLSATVRRPVQLKRTLSSGSSNVITSSQLQLQIANRRLSLI